MALKYKIFNDQYQPTFSDVIHYGKLIDGKQITKIVLDLYQQLKTQYRIQKIAISSLGIIDSETGKISGLGGIKNYHNVNWKNIFKKYRIPVSIENDANCAALYELSLNSSINNAAVFVVGTGLGGAIIINRHLYKGSHNGAGEVGIGPSEFKNNQFINISSVASTYTIVNGYYKLTKKKLGGREIFALYQKDLNAKKIIDRMIHNLSKTIINMSLFVDPDFVFIGGGISQNPTFMSLLNKEVTHLMKLSQLPKMFKLLQCHDNNDANINGALTLLK
jgi:predicted NBD/HSP70 family sugar kinase